jgi:Flp pilus assembly protein protease CpaA
MNIALLALSVPICIADMTSFVIPNIYHKILFYCTLTYLALVGIGQLRQVAVSLVILILLHLIGTGMGDLKLLALILLTHSFNAAEYIAFVYIVALVHIAAMTAFHRAIPSKIALAPSIFIGLGTYLATR